MPGAVYNLLHAHAVDANGFVTTRDAEDLGVPARYLQVLKHRGTLEAVSRGVFRFPDIPAGPLDGYKAAALWPLTVEGVLTHSTALDLHDLCDINPSRIDVTVPRAFRTTRSLPEVVRLHKADLPAADLTWHEGLRIATVPVAIRGAVGQGVGWNLIEQAIDNGRRRGRLTQAEAQGLRALRPAGRRAA